MNLELLKLILVGVVFSPLILPYIISEKNKLLLLPIVYLGPIGAFILMLYSYFSESFIGIKYDLYREGGVSLGMNADVLSTFVLFFVLTIGSIVLSFSYRYLQIDLNRDRFLKNLSYVLFSVTLMILSDNFIQFFIFWVLTSYFLHKLLIHVKDDSDAVLAARQKFWISRFGDSFLIIAISIYYIEFQTFDFSILRNLQAINHENLRLEYLGLFLVLGAITKSAQWPFHSWLPKTMNTPTPVSAIMHAGVINSGGYLLIRMNPILNQTEYSLPILALLGSITAFAGILMMWVQADIKKSLAYSTISQMGFMMLQIGVGAYAIALIHMMGHAFYKAYSFLSIGQALDYGRLNRVFKFKNSTNYLYTIFNFFIPLCFVVFFYLTVISANKIYKYQGIVLIGILVLSLIQAFNISRNLIIGIFNCILISSVYTALYYFSKNFFDSVIFDADFNNTTFLIFLNLILLIGFGFLFWFQNNLNQLNRYNMFRKIYVKMLNGI